jgi:uncharacterized protein (DUF58 family)
VDDTRAAAYRAFIVIAAPWIAVLGLAFRAFGLLVLALGLLAVLALSWRAARRGLRGLEVRRELYPNAFEGDTVAVDVVLENRRRGAAHFLEIGDVFGPGLADRQVVLEPGPLHGARRRRLRYRTFCSRAWGLYLVGPLSLSTSDPLGLFRAERGAGGIGTFAVFPQVQEMAGLERLGARPSLAPEETTAGRSGQSALYLGVRDYRPGDDLRRIHWPATARRGAPVVREHEMDLAPHFTLFLDLHRAHRAGTGKKSTLEYVVRAAAALLWSASRHGYAVQLVAEGAQPVFVAAGRGEEHLAHCLYELIRLRQDGTTPLLDVVERHRPHLQPGSTAALLNGTISLDTTALEELIEALAMRGVRPLLLFVNSDSFAAIDRWALPAKKARERCEEIRALLRSRGVPGAILDAEQELGTELSRQDLFLETP